MAKPPRLLLGLIAAAMLAGASHADDGRDLFGRRIRAILTDSCMSCHDAATKKGGFDLSRREAAIRGGDSGAAIEPGRPESSLLIDKVVSGEMPPKGDKLPPEAISELKAWITSGASYDGEPLAARRAGPDWWSIRPIAHPSAPPVKEPGRARNPIDAFVLARSGEAQGLAPAPEADRLDPDPPPHVRPDRPAADSPEEVAAFLAEDRNRTAYERLVDRLLASAPDTASAGPGTVAGRRPVRARATGTRPTP